MGMDKMAPQSKAPLPSSGPKKAKTPKAPKPKEVKKKKPEPKYQVMIIKAIRFLKEPNGAPITAIIRYIEQKFSVRNDYMVKHVINWLCKEEKLERLGTRVKIAKKEETKEAEGTKGAQKKKSGK